MSTTVTIRSRYNLGDPPKGVAFSMESMTDPSFMDETDIENIIKLHNKTGSWGPSRSLTAQQPWYGDFSSGEDFRSLVDQIKQTNDAFLDLPSGMRGMFENDPSNLLDFLANPANKKEAQELGLISPDSPQEIDPSNPVETVHKPVEKTPEPQAQS